MHIPGYNIIEKIYEGTRTAIYRAVCIGDNTPAIIKIPAVEHPDMSVVTMLKHEYEVNKVMVSNRVVKILELKQVNNLPILIQEDFNGVSLRSILDKGKLELKTFLRLAIGMSEGLYDIHSSNVVHNDIKPNNIIVNEDTLETKITDFGIAVMSSVESGSSGFPQYAGTISYISPEQTGRVNVPVDYRTDFYSLGVTFYEMLVGQLPFTAEDELGLIHCHLAKKPVEPSRINRSIPKTVSDIILKLLEKMADNRYQNALGLKKDLEKCLLLLEGKGEIDAFEPGQWDFTDRFSIPHKLYGREKEKEVLMGAFHRVCGTGHKEVLMVAGYSGIGKSSLVNEIYKPVANYNVLFISGKFDQYQNDIPYSAIVKAFEGLIQQILADSPEQVAAWRTGLCKALGSNGKVVAEVIPDIVKIIGEQPDVIELPAEETLNRFNMVFQNFVRVFCDKKHPLVVFIDDLQWADLSSLKLISTLSRDPDLQYLLLVGSYRDNEVHEKHALKITLDNIKLEGAAVETITLTPLKSKDINDLLADTLRCSTEEAVSLADVCLKKTEGNPFFLGQFLSALYREGLISFDKDCCKWTWDLHAIHNARITDNVLELISGRISTFSLKCRQALLHAACIGSRFELKTLAAVLQKPVIETYEAMLEAQQQNLVSISGDVFSLISGQAEVDIVYSFLHDRVQQSAYTMIEAADRQKIHISIGRLMLGSLAWNECRDKILDIVNHMNIGMELIVDPSEKEDTARLELLAAKKAKKATAYAIAYKYAKLGIALLGDRGWNSKYDLALELHIEAAALASLNGDFEAVEKFIETALKHSKTQLDKVKVLEEKIVSYTAQNRLMEANAVALSALRLMGVRLSKYSNVLNVLIAYVNTRVMLLGKQPEALAEKEQMTDLHAKAAYSTLVKMGLPSYKTDPNNFMVAALKGVQLSAKYGNTDISSIVYVAYGMLLCYVGEIDKGHRFGALALKLLKSMNAKECAALTLVVYNACIGIWKSHLKDTLKPLAEANLIGLETGNVNWACAGACVYCCHAFYTGMELPRLENEMAAYTEVIRRTKYKEWLDPQRIFHQTVLNLMDQNEDPCSLNGSIYREEVMLPEHIIANDRNSIIDVYLNKLMLNYMFGKYDEAYKNALLAGKYLDGANGSIVVPVFYFYDSLSAISRFGALSFVSQRLLLKRIDKNQSKLKKWAKHAPDNFLNKYLLVEAEKARVLKKHSRAMVLYDKAVQMAAKNGYLQEEALANELAARFYMSLGNQRVGKMYLEQALYCFNVWGAAAKVKQLKEEFFELLLSVLKNKSEKQTETFTSTRTTEGIVSLDTATIIKATQAISGEIVLDELLKKLILILLENAGAERACYLIKYNGAYLIEAEGRSEKEGIEVLHGREPDLDYLPLKVLQYVENSGQSVVLGNAAAAELFVNDPYIASHMPKSIICMPVLSKGQVNGLLYLENNLIEEAFSLERIEILKVVSSQLAISMENATLYTRLEELVEDRTKELIQTADNVKNLLNNAGQGFLSFGQDLLINKDFSTECYRIFGGNIAGKKYSELIFGNIPSMKKHVDEVLNTVFQTEDEDRKTVFLSLMPTEIKMESIYLRIEYKLIASQLADGSNSIMVIITDITERRILERRAEEEKNTLRMIVKAFTNKDEFINLIKEYQRFYSYNINNILEFSASLEDSVIEVFRMVHTFKGNMSIFTMSASVNNLHAVETSIAELKNGIFSNSKEKIREFFSAIPFERMINEDMQKINEILGEEFFTGDNVVAVEESKIRNIESRLLDILSPDECKLLLPQIRSLTYKPFRDLLKSYPDYVMNLSGRIDKLIQPLVIEGGTFMVDREKYAPFTKALVHVFRNALDHGIELPDERVCCGKDEYGTIKCKIEQLNSHICLTISDDGRGISTDAVGKTAVELGMYDEEEIDKLSENEIVRLILKDEFTTKHEVSSLSGRGVGLAAVRDELEKLQGSVAVKTRAGEGTEFCFCLPYESIDI